MVNFAIHLSATPAVSPRCPDPDAYLFGNSVQGRRQELGLSVFEAADRSGMTVYQWAAVEEGCWVPNDRNLLRAMAGTLEANAFMMLMVASLSAWAMSGYPAEQPAFLK